MRHVHGKHTRASLLVTQVDVVEVNTGIYHADNHAFAGQRGYLAHTLVHQVNSREIAGTVVVQLQAMSQRDVVSGKGRRGEQFGRNLCRHKAVKRAVDDDSLAAQQFQFFFFLFFIGVQGNERLIINRFGWLTQRGACCLVVPKHELGCRTERALGPTHCNKAF